MMIFLIDNFFNRIDHLIFGGFLMILNLISWRDQLCYLCIQPIELIGNLTLYSCNRHSQQVQSIALIIRHQEIILPASDVTVQQ